jgi:hypothetical protein
MNNKGTKYQKKQNPICNDERKCFAQAKKGKKKYCLILNDTYPNLKCPFCKQKKE